MPGGFSTVEAVALQCSSILAYPQFGPGHQFVLETDASLAGLGTVLSQNDDKGHLHPVAYASRALLKHEVNYHITELETLVIVWAVKYFRPYLWVITVLYLQIMQPVLLS